MKMIFPGLGLASIIFLECKILWGGIETEIMISYNFQRNHFEWLSDIYTLLISVVCTLRKQSTQ